MASDPEPFTDPYTSKPFKLDSSGKLSYGTRDTNRSANWMRTIAENERSRQVALGF